MNDHPTRIEIFPNEIFLDIFQYLDAAHIFRSFYNLNTRFDNLLQSLDNLCLHLPINNTDETIDYRIFEPGVQTLKLNKDVNLRPDEFTNIRCLQLLMPTDQQLQLNIYPYLEYLSIILEKSALSQHFLNLWERILSNDFPKLKSFDLSKSSLIFEIPLMIQSSNLLNLKLPTINFATYQIILSHCLNLSSFQFTIIPRWNQRNFAQPHLKLKRLIIHFIIFMSPINDCNIDDYLSFVPNLNKLIIYRTIHTHLLDKYFNYKWLALHINKHLLLLHEFKFHLSINHCHTPFIVIENNILDCIQERFKRMHDNRYQSKLFINQIRNNF